jgi:hypothetical protein
MIKWYDTITRLKFELNKHDHLMILFIIFLFTDMNTQLKSRNPYR